MQDRGDKRSFDEIEPEQLRNALLAEVKRMNEGRKGRSVWEVITQVQVVKQAFTDQPGALTRTMKIRREAIGELYSEEIESITSRMR
jgi:long-subunit acyl-CoA synthetase (AMP-forming)